MQKKNGFNQFVFFHISAKNKLDFSAKVFFSAGYRERTTTVQIVHYQNSLIGGGGGQWDVPIYKFRIYAKNKWHGTVRGFFFLFLFCFVFSHKDIFIRRY